MSSYSSRCLYTEAKIQKVIRFFKGRRVELPIKDKPIANNVVISPKIDDDTMYV